MTLWQDGVAPDAQVVGSPFLRSVSTFICYLVLFSLGLPWFSVLAETPGERVIDTIVAVVNGRVITQREIEIEQVLQQTVDAATQENRQTLNRLIGRELMIEEAAQWGILEVTDSELQQAHIHLASQSESADAFQNVMQRHAIELEELQHRLRQTLIANKFVLRQWTEPIRIQQGLRGQALQDEVNRRSQAWIQRRLNAARVQITDPTYQAGEAAIDREENREARPQD